jgi:purine-binding chemotaxis protein CheW
MEPIAARDQPTGDASAPHVAPHAVQPDLGRWVVFRLDEGRYALPLDAVQRVVRAAWITPLPLAPSVVMGALDVAGEVLPVFNLRQRFRLPERWVEPSDQFLLARTAQRTVVLVIDAALCVVEKPATAMVDADRLVTDLAHIRGVLPLEDGLILIQDIEQFLSSDEQRLLDAALQDEDASHGG